MEKRDETLGMGGGTQQKDAVQGVRLNSFREER